MIRIVECTEIYNKYQTYFPTKYNVPHPRHILKAGFPFTPYHIYFLPHEIEILSHKLKSFFFHKKMKIGIT